MNTYKIIYQRYERYGEGKIREERFECPSDKLAVLYADPNVGFDACRLPDNDEWSKEDVALALQSPLDQLVEELEETNGDGCDFVDYLENETTGKILIGGHEFDTSVVKSWDYGETEEDFINTFKD